MLEETFREYVSAYNDGDLEATSEFWAEDITLVLPGNREDVHGKDAAIAFFEKLMAAVREEIEIHRVWSDAEGRHLATELESTFTALRDLPDFHYGSLSEGEQTSNRTFIHYDVNEEGKFVENRVAHRDPSPSMAPGARTGI